MAIYGYTMKHPSVGNTLRFSTSTETAYTFVFVAIFGMLFCAQNSERVKWWAYVNICYTLKALYLLQCIRTFQLRRTSRKVTVFWCTQGSRAESNPKMIAASLLIWLHLVTSVMRMKDCPEEERTEAMWGIHLLLKYNKKNPIYNIKLRKNYFKLFIIYFIILN